MALSWLGQFLVAFRIRMNFVPCFFYFCLNGERAWCGIEECRSSFRVIRLGLVYFNHHVRVAVITHANGFRNPYLEVIVRNSSWAISFGSLFRVFSGRIASYWNYNPSEQNLEVCDTDLSTVEWRSSHFTLPSSCLRDFSLSLVYRAEEWACFY
jgi:hypothetical protein